MDQKTDIQSFDPAYTLPVLFFFLFSYLALAGEVLVDAGPGDQADNSGQGQLESARGET